MARSRHWLRCCVSVLVALTYAATFVVAQSFNTSSSPQYLQLRWTETDVVRVTFAEPLLRNALQEFFASPDEAQVLDVREETFPVALNAAVSSTFLVLFNVTCDSRGMTDASVTEALSTFLASSDDQLQTESASTPLALFSAATMRFTWLSATDVFAFAPFAAVERLPVPTQSFLMLHVSFRNMLSPRNLTRGMIYQTRQGIARFLNLSAITDVYAAGPPTVPDHNALQVIQKFYLLLRSDASATLEGRERIANLLLYGDAGRQVADYAVNDGFFATNRPAMFLDFVLPATSPVALVLSSTSLSPSPDAAELVMADALLTYAFASLTVEQLPDGNPPVPAPPSSSTTTIPDISTDALLAKMRKRQRFLYDDAAFATSASSLPAMVAFPSATTAIDPSAPSACTMTSGYCTYVYWTNALERSFWVESVESVHRMAWNLFPSTPLFATTDPAPTAIAPVVAPGNTSTPIWTFGALSGPSSRLDFALNLRSVGDRNATALKVEIQTDVRSPTDATSVVTSVARDTLTPSDPVFATASNVVVRYQSRFRNTNELFLFLSLERSSATAADTTQPCAHCLSLLDWCKRQPACAALASCVFLEGLEADAVPSTMLLTHPLSSVVDVSPYFRKCLSDSAAAKDVRALVLLSNAVRCQMQRLCPFRTAADYSGSSSSDATDKMLVWESIEGRQLLQTRATNSHFSNTLAVNVSLRLGSETLCVLPILATTTADALEDAIARTCKLAKYLGRVSVRVNMTGASAATATAASYDSVELRYKYVVGPLPALAIVSSTSSSSTVNSTTTAAAPLVDVSTLALPGVRLRLETRDFASRLPPAPAAATPDACATCSRLALDGCLRSLACVAFTDCVLQFPAASAAADASSSQDEPAPSSSLSDVVLQAFETRATGQQIAFTSAVDACHSSASASSRAWRALVTASACFSRHACPLSLELLVPQSTGVVGTWHIAPSYKVQKLLYQQQQSTDLTAQLTALSVPLSLGRDSTDPSATVQSATSAGDAPALTQALRTLLAYDALDVAVEFDRVDSASSLRSAQWSITYWHWIGRLPRVVADTSTPEWTLFTLPSDETDALYMELRNASAAATASGSRDQDTTTVAVVA